MLYTALLPEDYVWSWPPVIIPPRLNFSTFITVFEERPILLWLSNTILVSVLTVILSVPPALLAGYAFYRFDFRGKSSLFRLLFLTMVVPPTVIIVPYYLVLDSWGLTDSLIGLAITYLAFTIPTEIIIFYGYLFSIPRELEEAALLDGCSPLGVFVRIILPLSVPGIIAISIYSFSIAWNEFAFAMTLLRSPSNWTAVAGIRTFIGQWMLAWDKVMITCVYFTIPAIIFYFLTQKYFVSGMTAGALKF
ncbi:carbohydrate ABC transporter permease [Candidatus Bathyarchaeota archaeon]|nr:MAG: carbohydrate ABC transporter permease [Candidatus Bathyarchaeota archaeon]